MDQATPTTILLVESTAIVGLIEAGILKDMGYETRLAFTGQKAVLQATTDPDIDLVLIDADLGQGLDSMLAARAILRRRKIPIILLTSDGNSLLPRKEWLPDRVLCLSRDSNPSTLQSMIHSAVEQI